MFKTLSFSSPSARLEFVKAQPVGSLRNLWRAWWPAAVGTMSAGLCLANPPVMRDAATHEQLAQQMRRIQQADPMQQLPPSQGEDPSQNLPKDLVSQSDILCFGGMMTLVPKRAILRIPKPFAHRVQLIPGCKLMGWAEFYAQNRGWITTVEVSRVQAEGSQPLPEDLTVRLKDSTNLIVATFRGGPISVLPLTEPPPVMPSPIATSRAITKP